MTTIADLIERTYRTYLYPPDYEPAMVLTTTAMDAIDDPVSFDIGDFHVPEDEQLIRMGSLFEAGSELIRTTDWDSIAKTVTGTRARRGTTIAAHPSGTELTLIPSYPRLSVFEAVRDNITMLSPRLFTVSQDYLAAVTDRVAPMEDELAVSVIEAWPDSLDNTVSVHARIVDYHPAIGGRALITNLNTGAIWIRYKRRMGVPLLESETIADLGIESVWELVIMIGVAADLLVGRDIPQSQAEYIGAVLQAENIPVGTRTSIAVGLGRYRDMLLDRFAAEMTNEYRKGVRMRSPFETRARANFG